MIRIPRIPRISSYRRFHISIQIILPIAAWLTCKSYQAAMKELAAYYSERCPDIGWFGFGAEILPHTALVLAIPATVMAWSGCMLYRRIAGRPIKASLWNRFYWTTIAPFFLLLLAMSVQGWINDGHEIRQRDAVWLSG